MNDYLKQVEDQLVELTERGAHRRPRPRLDVLAVAGAVAVVAAVAAVVATIGGGTHRTGVASHHGSAIVAPPKPSVSKHTVTVGPNYTLAGPPAGGPVPRGFGPQSFTAIGELSWWLLGSAPCSSPPCTSIVRTTNGGRTFVGIPAPRTDRVSQLRFADASNGFAYGPDLWVTHNGGSQWNQVPLPGEVRELAASVGFVYAIVTNTATGVGELMRSPVGADVWTPLPAAGDVSSGLWVQGDDVLVEASSRSAQQLRVSHDAGQTFATDQVPPSVACRFEEPAPPVVWEPCSTGMLSGIWRSDDDGRIFARIPGHGLPQLPNSAAFGSASATTAVVGYRQLYRTTDGGTTWAPVSGPTGISWWQYIGFTDPTHGVAIGYAGSEQPSNERLYYTADGGASYHLVSIG